MGFKKEDLLVFSKEEKKEIDQALSNVLDDLEELWKHSSKTEIYTYYRFNRNSWDTDSWRFSINEDGITIKDYPDEYALMQFKKVIKRPKIKNYTAIYYFLKCYDDVRSYVEKSIISANDAKGKGIQEIIDIKNKYAKEATIEVDLPETMNPHSIEVKEENGRTIGEINMGYGAIRIITKGPISITRSEESSKRR